MPYSDGSETPPSRPAASAPNEVWRISASLSRMERNSTPAVAPKQAKFHTPIGPWMKSYPMDWMFISIRALSGQCRPSGTRNGYSSGMMMAKTNGACPLSHARPTPSAFPAHTPIGPTMNAVSAPTMTREKNGTNTSCTLSGMIFFNPW